MKKFKLVHSPVAIDPRSFGYECHGREVDGGWMYEVHADGGIDLPPGCSLLPSLMADDSDLPTPLKKHASGKQVYHALKKAYAGKGHNLDDILPL